MVLWLELAVEIIQLTKNILMAKPKAAQHILLTWAMMLSEPQPAFKAENIIVKILPRGLRLLEVRVRELQVQLDITAAPAAANPQPAAPVAAALRDTLVQAAQACLLLAAYQYLY